MTPSMCRTLFVLGLSVLALAGGTPTAALAWPSGPTTTQFGTRHNDEAFAVSENAVVGVTKQGADEDGFLRYFGLHGHTEWRVRIATPGEDRPVAVAQTDRRIFVAGSTTGALGDGPAHGTLDVFVRAYTTTGRLRWSRQFGTKAEDVATAIGAGDLPGLTVAGWTEGNLAGPSAGGGDAFVLHLTRGGLLRWSTQIGTPWEDRARCVDPYEPELVCGSTTGSMPGGTYAGGVDTFVARISQADGAVDWIRQLGTAADDVPAGVGEPWFGGFEVGGTTEGTFPGATGHGGQDAFVATYSSDLTDPSLIDVEQFGTPTDENVDGFWTGTFAFIGGTTHGTFPGETAVGGVDGWVSMLDVPLFEGVSAGTVWTQQFGTGADDRVDGFSGPFKGGASSDYTYAVGGTMGVFPGESSFGKRDAFWSLRFEPNDAMTQDVLLRGLAAAQAYRDDHAGTYDGFDQADASQMNPSYVWLNGPMEPNSPVEMTIADAAGTTVRLISYSKSGNYICVEEVAGVVGYGHSLTYDQDSCSGGW
jgi:hypothetical protein